MHKLDNIVHRGASLETAKLAIIAVHGRGASPESILTLQPHLSTDTDICWIAPAAANNTWYPYSFMAPFEANQPWLGSALELMQVLFNRVEARGPGLAKLIVFGFSQGGCLALESVIRLEKNIRAVAGFSSGLIGPEGTTWDQSPTLSKTRSYIGCSDIDSHIPITRVRESEVVFNAKGSELTVDIFKNGGHNIFPEEIAWLSSQIEQALTEEA